MVFRLLFFTMLLVLSQNLFSQRQILKRNNWYSEVKYHYGFVTPHHKSITYYLEEHIKGIEVDVGWKTNGSKYWHPDYNYPYIGIGYYHSGLANDLIFGKANALFMYLKSNKSPSFVNFRFYNKFCFGLSHVSKKYDLYENHYNISIGSHINAFLQGTFGIDYNLSPNMTITGGLGFTHMSNGKFKEPNQGLNIFTTSIGMAYDLKKTNTLPLSQRINNSPDYHFTLISSIGIKQVSRRLKGSYLASSLVFDIDLLKLKKYHLGFGFDFFYDSSTKRQYEFEKFEFVDKSENYRLAVHLSYKAVVGRTSFIIQPGLYLWNYDKTYRKISNRLGIRYHFTNHILFNVSVKAHWVSIADYIEWGVGYAW